MTDAELLAKITVIHAESKGTYGAPRIHKELLHRHVACGKRRVTRLMRQAGLEGRCKKRWRTTTVADPNAEAIRDLIRRHFGPSEEIDRRYVGDITYIATWEGWAYLATVIDLASRKVVGWALADHMRTELVTDALSRVFTHRAPKPAPSSIPTAAGNTRAATSPIWREPMASCSRLEGRVNAGTTRWLNHFSPPSNESSSTRKHGRRGTDSDALYSSTSKAGTTPAGCTRRLDTSAPLNTKQSTTTPTLRRHNQHKQPVRRSGSSRLDFGSKFWRLPRHERQRWRLARRQLGHNAGRFRSRSGDRGWTPLYLSQRPP